MDESGSGLHPKAVSDITGVEPSSSAIAPLVRTFVAERISKFVLSHLFGRSVM